MLSNLYTLTEQKEDFFSIKLADSSHPVFKAHFPTNPLLPGFLMIEIISKVLKCEIIQIKKVKFLNQAFPQDELSFNFKGNSVTIKKDEIKVAQIVFNKI